MKALQMYTTYLWVVWSSFISICPTAKAQQFVYERYTVAWVMNYDDDQGGQRPNTLLPSPVYNPNVTINLVIPERETFVKDDHGNAYIKVYLINSSSNTLAVDREDATVSRISTEVYINGKWKLFQSKIGSSCGNSYWTMKLRPNHYLYLHLENRTEGPIRVPYRVRFKTAKYEAISNPITVNITPELLRLARTKPVRISG